MTEYLYDLGLIFTQNKLEKLLSNNLSELDLKLSCIKKLYSNQSTLYLRTTLQDLFMFQINKDKISVWNYSGGILIINSLKIPNNGWTLNYTIEYIFKALDNFTNGWLVCSGCSRAIRYEDAKNNVSQSGFFCDGCWNEKYKSLAKKERYD